MHSTLSGPELKIVIHSQDAEKDGLPERLHDGVLAARESQQVDEIVSKWHPRLIRDATKHEKLPHSELCEQWTEQFRRFQAFSTRKDADWELLWFERSKSFEDQMYHYIEFPDTYMTVIDTEAGLPPLTVTERIYGVFPAAVSGREYTCSDALEVIAGEQDWPSKDMSISDVGSSGSKKHDNWRDLLISSWDRVVDDGDWTVDSVEFSFNVSNETGGTGSIDLVMRRSDRKEYYLVEIKPDPTRRDELDRGIGQILRYEAMFREENVFEDLDISDIRLAVALPEVPEPYSRIADRHDVELIDIKSTLDSR